MTLPPFLKENDLVGLVSPAGKIESFHLENAKKFLETKKLRYIIGSNAAGSYYQYSSTDEKRAEDLQNMINNPEVKAIWCTRGGYGVIRLVEKIDFSSFKTTPKWLIGFSDITVLHSVLREKYKTVSIHAPMCINLCNENFAETGVNNLFNLLFGKIPEYELYPHQFNRLGKAKGMLIGGNLSLLCALAGSEYDFTPKGKILFIEDTGEYLYRLDRMMQSLKISGKLAELSGLIVGQMSDMKDNVTPFGTTAYEIIAEAVADYNYPLIFDFPAGHTKHNEPLLLGMQAEIDVSINKPYLIYLMNC